MVADLLSAAEVLLFATLAMTTMTAAHSAEPRWATSQQFGPAYVKAEFPLDQRTVNALRHLDTTRSDLTERLGLEIPAAPVEIHLFRSRRSYDYYIRQRIPEGVGRAALFVKNGDAGRVYAYYSGRLDVDMRHESTHAFLHAALPFVPLWLDEGIAEYFEVAPSARHSRHQHLSALERAMWFRWKPRLDRLEALTKLSDMGEAEYRESWAWVHFMFHGPPEVQNVLKTYLQEIANGGYPGAIAPRLKAVVADPDKQLKIHLKAIR